MPDIKNFVDFDGNSVEEILHCTTDSHGLMCPDDKIAIANLNTLVGDTSVADQIATAIDAIPQADLAQTDETAKDYVKNKPTSEDIVQMLVEMDVIQPVSDENNVVYTDTNGKTFVL